MATKTTPMLLAVTAALACAGCAAAETTSILLSIEASPGVTIASLTGALRVGSASFEPAQMLGSTPPTLPGRVVIPLVDDPAQVEVRLIATDDRGAELGAHLAVTSIAHRQVQRTVVLSDTCPLGVCIPATGTPAWLPAIDLPGSRLQVAATVGTDGALYVVSGQADYTAAADAQTYVLLPGAAEWTTGPPQAMPRSASSAVTLPDGRIVVVGGEDDTKSYPDVDALDPGTATWTKLPPLQNGISRAAAMVDSSSGSIFVVGGSPAAESSPVATTSIFANGAWSPGPKLPDATLRAAGVVRANGRLCVIGGVAQDFVATFLCLDGAHTKWQALAPMTSKRSRHAGVLGADDRVYAIGGDLTSGPIATVEAFDALDGGWAAVAPMPETRYAHAALRGADGRIYAIGGVVGGNPSASVIAYGPRVMVTPTAVRESTRVTVSGDNFAANAVVLLYLEDDLAVPIARGSTDGTGTLAPITFRMVAHAAGVVGLRVVDHRSAYPVSTRLTISD